MAAADCTARIEREDRTIARALRILEKRAKYDANRLQIGSPIIARTYLRFRLNDLRREEFWCVWLDAATRPIETECLFVGTLTQAAVYPREIVRRALHHNAAGVILAHNHPSGNVMPSDNDKKLTQTLQNALRLIDVEVRDHLIVGAPAEMFSFAVHGLL